MRIIFLFLWFVSMATQASENFNAANTNVQLGLAYLQKGLYSASKQSLLTAIQDDSHIAAVWYGMGYYLEKTGNQAAANQYYQYAISVEPHSGSAKNNYGNFLCRAGKYQAAIHEFILATRERDYLNTANAYKNAGICALKIPDKLTE